MVKNPKRTTYSFSKHTYLPTPGRLMYASAAIPAQTYTSSSPKRAAGQNHLLPGHPPLPFGQRAVIVRQGTQARTPPSIPSVPYWQKLPKPDQKVGSAGEPEDCDRRAKLETALCIHAFIFLAR